jgi:predicted transcriptional regulator of viral defense system
MESYTFYMASRTHSSTTLQTLAPSRMGSRAFFSANPVFRREDYAAAVGRRANDKVVTVMLAQHLKAGNIKRMARGVFATVPSHGDAGAWTVDRFLAASRLRRDAVLAYHSALELHGCAYTDAPDVQAISSLVPAVLNTPDFACRFVKVPAGFDPARDVAEADRAGLMLKLTTLERTVVDCFDRPDLAGGAEELINSLALVERLRSEPLVRQAQSLGNAAACGALGWWLEREQARLGVPDAALAALKASKPNHPQYVLGAKAGAARSIAAWNILVPATVVDAGFEGA